MSSLSTVFANLLRSTIDSLNPSRLIKNHLKLTDNTLSVSTHLKFDNESLSNISDEFQIEKNIYVIAFGKAALGMCQTIESILKEKITSGIAIIPINDAKKFPKSDKTNELFPNSNSKIRYFYGAENNLPDLNSISASLEIYEFCKKLKQNDILLCLISGGGSALLSLPVDIDGNQDYETNLKLKILTIKAIVNAGCNINELNTIRSCLSRVKSGQLAEICQAKIISLIISDVIDDKLEVISSGPTLIQQRIEKFKNSLDLIEKYKLKDKIPNKVIEYLEKHINLTLKNPTIRSSHVYHYLIGNNKYATNSMINNLLLNDYYKVNLTNSLQGEAKLIGSIYACLAFLLLTNKHLNDKIIEDLKSIINKIDFLSVSNFEIIKNFGFLKLFVNKLDFKDENNEKLCIISGGETTVTFNESLSEINKGGRNMEMSLAFEYVFNKLKNVSRLNHSNYGLLFSSFGTDGIDGPTDSAGAYYETDSNKTTDEINLVEMNDYLSNHNSYNYYLNNQRLLLTGPTGTNVSDVQVLLINFKQTNL